MAQTDFDLAAISNSFTGGADKIGSSLQYLGVANANESNASLYEMDAKMVLADSKYAAKRMAEQGESFVGSQVARYAKAGVLFEGSPMKVMLQTERNIRLDIMTNKYNAVRKANSLGMQSLKSKLAAGRARTQAVQKFGQGVIDMTKSYALATI